MQEKAGPAAAAVHDRAGFLRHDVGDALGLPRLHEGLPVQARVLRDHLLSHHGRGRRKKKNSNVLDLHVPSPRVHRRSLELVRTGLDGISQFSLVAFLSFLRS